MCCVCACVVWVCALYIYCDIKICQVELLGNLPKISFLVENAGMLGTTLNNGRLWFWGVHAKNRQQKLQLPIPNNIANLASISTPYHQTSFQEGNIISILTKSLLFLNLLNPNQLTTLLLIPLSPPQPLWVCIHLSSFTHVLYLILLNIFSCIIFLSFLLWLKMSIKLTCQQHHHHPLPKQFAFCKTETLLNNNSQFFLPHRPWQLFTLCIAIFYIRFLEIIMVSRINQNQKDNVAGTLS